MVYHWKYSGILLLIGALIVAWWVATESYFGMLVMGGTIAAILDFRFLLIAIVGFFGLKYLNPIFLAIIAGLIYQSYLHLTLQDYWARLEINPSFSDGFVRSLFAGLLLFSIAHLIGVLISNNRKSGVNQ